MSDTLPHWVTASGQTSLSNDVPPDPIEEQEEWMIEGDWAACAHPERPMDIYTVLHDCCRGCLIALQASVLAGHASDRMKNGSDLLATKAERLERFGPAPRSAVTP